MGTSSYSSKGGPLLPLGPAEKEILGLLQKGVTDSRMIASRRGITQRRVNKIIQNLRSKGYVGVAIPGVPKTGQTLEPQTSLPSRYNLHALRLRATVHHQGPRYQKSPNQVFDDFHGVQVVCKDRYVLLRSKGQRFYGESVDKALWKSIPFWKRLIRRLENRLDCIILKPEGLSYEVLYAEWGEGDAVEAVVSQEQGQRWRVFSDHDGKLRVSTDDSIGPELEFHHTRTGYPDRVTWTRHMTAILNSPEAPTMPELARTLGVHLELSRDTAAGLKSIVDLLKPPSSPPGDDKSPHKPFYVG